eukprot:12467340-Alexandrium_andersonii.AAC.1
MSEVAGERSIPGLHRLTGNAQFLWSVQSELGVALPSHTRPKKRRCDRLVSFRRARFVPVSFAQDRPCFFNWSARQKELQGNAQFDFAWGQSLDWTRKNGFFR